MSKRLAVIVFAVSLLFVATAQGEEARPALNSVSRPYSVSTSLFTLANLVPDDYPPYFFQLNVGYQLTPNDRLSIEAITWRYYHPLGVPYGDSFGSTSEAYPGHVREYGLGLAYQRKKWKGIYASAEAVPLWRQFYDEQDQKIGDGFQLFLTLRFGYYLEFWDRLFIEPSVAFNYWPIATGGPSGFAARDEKWPSYFLFEPGLHLGVVF